MEADLRNSGFGLRRSAAPATSEEQFETTRRSPSVVQPSPTMSVPPGGNPNPGTKNDPNASAMLPPLKTYTYHQHPVWRKLCYFSFYAALFYSSGGPFFAISLLQQCGILSSWVRTSCVNEPGIRICQDPELPNGYENLLWKANFPLVSDPLRTFFPVFKADEFVKMRTEQDISASAQTSPMVQLAELPSDLPASLEVQHIIDDLAPLGTSTTTPRPRPAAAQNESQLHHAPPIAYNATAAALAKQEKLHPSILRATTDFDLPATVENTRFHVMTLNGQNFFAYSLPYYILAVLLENYLIYFVLPDAAQSRMLHKPTLPGSIANLGQGVLMFLCSQMLFLNYKDPVYSYLWEHYRLSDVFANLDSLDAQWALDERSLELVPRFAGELLSTFRAEEQGSSSTSGSSGGPSRSARPAAGMSDEDDGFACFLRGHPFFASLVAYYVCLLLLDFFYYAWHRASHRISWLWAAHWVHHSTEEYNISVTFREPLWLSEMLIPLQFAIMRLPVAFLGFPVVYMNTISLNDTLYMNWLHTELTPPLPLTEMLFMTPSLHRVHHARNLRALAKNYGSMFSVWDRLCGTYEPEILAGEHIKDRIKAEKTTTKMDVLKEGQLEDKKRPLLKIVSAAEAETCLVNGGVDHQIQTARELEETTSSCTSRYYSLWLRLTRFYRVRRDRRVCRDDFEPIRYGVIPQFHSYDVLQQNLAHWRYMILDQTKFHGIFAPFLHWTRPKTKCPPLSANSKINGHRKFRADALHVFWSGYVVLQFLIFFASALTFVATNFVLSQNLAKTFYGSCDTPLMDPVTCSAGPWARYFGPQQLTSAMLQMISFVVGVWTMGNLGMILMATEYAPTNVGQKEGFVPLHGASCVGLGGAAGMASTTSSGGAVSANGGAIEREETSSTAGSGRACTSVASANLVSAKQMRGLMIENDLLLDVDAQSDASSDITGASNSTAMGGRTSSLMTGGNWRVSGAAARMSSSSLVAVVNGRLRSLEAPAGDAEDEHNAPPIDASHAQPQYGAQILKGNPDEVEFFQSGMSTSASSTSNFPTLLAPKNGAGSSTSASSSTANLQLVGAAGVAPGGGAFAVGAADADGQNKLTPTTSSTHHDTSWQKHISSANSSQLYFDTIFEEAPPLTPGERVYERNCIYAEMLRHWCIVFLALQFGDALYNFAQPDAAATVSRECVLLVLVYTALHCVLLPGLAFISGHSKLARESAARRRYRG
mmetsp:Transcript_13665/g.33636  ORF Transcript_13665/g.33636 Transcript_13665/m.33636 type:complete len:1220 (+) Transcript_13665:404-4063(+)